MIYDARAAAEKAEHARNHARNVAYHNYYKKVNSITGDLAAINRETAAIKREKDQLSEKLRAGTRWTPEERKRFYKLSEQSRQLFEQSVQLHKDFDQLDEEYNAKYNNGN